MRILFLTQWFQPEPFFKGVPFAKALMARGHDVEVLTGFPNYPGGKVYPGYRIRLYQKENIDGITVHRVALYPSHDTSALRRIVNYLSFSLSAFFIGPWCVKKPDVIYVYNLVTLGLPAYLFRLLFGSKVLIDVQDLWPESVTNSRMMNAGMALSFLGRVCRWVYRKADLVTVLSPGFKKELTDRGVLTERVQVIYNWCDEASLSIETGLSGPQETGDSGGTFTVLFAGAMGRVQGLETVLDCAKLCKERMPGVRFVLIGGGVEHSNLQRRAEEMGLDNVTFLPPRSPAEMGDVFAEADALLVHLNDDPLFRITIPSKTQAYLFKGKPVIMAVRGDAADLVRQAGAGIVCEPANPRALLEAVAALYDMGESERCTMGEAGHRYYMDHLSFDRGVKRFEVAMTALAEQAA